MAKNLHITVADQVFEKIDQYMIIDSKINRSEFVEELIRYGLMVYADRQKYFKNKKEDEKHEEDIKTEPN